ncbi:MAG: hypothetical protein ACFNQI_01960 [Eikenella corrodens]|jgi:hypothetical protein|uniref:Uncharacterized protein n=1 Tax=Myoviridae sp. ctiv53 TaxID=2827703 RepID=A0A8S5TIC8_9CAUD|nr:MAG TPA: Protein of unknown function (DUF1043) [Myoviridae sp. ctiv53]
MSKAAAILLGIIIGLPAGEYINDTYRTNQQAAMQAELDNAERRAGLYFQVNQDLQHQITAADLATEQARADCHSRRQDAALAAATSQDPMAGVVLEPAGE